MHAKTCWDCRIIDNTAKTYENDATMYEFYGETESNLRKSIDSTAFSCCGVWAHYDQQYELQRVQENYIAAIQESYGVASRRESPRSGTVALTLY